MENSIHHPIIRTAIFFWATLALAQHACQPAAEGTGNPAADSANSAAFTACLQKHLDAVSNKDLPGLESTLSPDGNMQLILPNREITNTVAEFVDMHRDWFQDTSWTFATKILNTEVGDKIGTATTEIMYREPNRNGKPYFNRMAVSYTLKKTSGNWYVIKDHACSLEKSEN